MTTQTLIGDHLLRKEIIGSRRLSNYFWAVIVSMGGIGFLLSGISSYLKVNLLFVADPSQLSFLPQGIAMGFYGVLGTVYGLFLWLTIMWDVGGGYNEYNQEKGQVIIFRWGFPGKNRKVEFTCSVENVQSIKVDIKEGLNPRRAIYLRLKDSRQIPLTRVGQPLALSTLENEAAQLAKFLQVPLEGL
ncbi:MAG: photosystem I assembly protein Ycf4 [Okeania sp. SIO3B5]|uniref:photosystem I assembly protein Ycf4 n=1 Tax=Okeania sp. SIO3B5 TaxID=2607811 RepID=UPI00140162AA|nr:photosystem I assembly protein Ycf4 [Okeania sp. SIO3B5]NEO53645.1 photosystem I assembly protein Ycf4 [Okeania sp. SIO3B5]